MIDPSQIQEIPGMPGMNGKSQKISMENYRIRYYKADLDDPGSVAMIEYIETESLKPEANVVLLGKDKFSFQSGYYIVVSYLEKRGFSSQTRSLSGADVSLGEGPDLEETAKSWHE